MLPEPEYENNPILDTGGSKTLSELPKHQGIVLFFANERSLKLYIVMCRIRMSRTQWNFTYTQPFLS